MGNYEGSILQEFLEELRIEYKDNSGVTLEGLVIDKDKSNPYFLLLASDTPKSMIPKNIAPTKLVEKKEIVEEIEVREVREVKRKKKAALKKKKSTKKKKEVPTKVVKRKERKDKGKKRKKTTKKSTSEKVRLAELRVKELELLREDFKDGIYTKSEYKSEREKLLKKYAKGGKI